MQYLQDDVLDAWTFFIQHIPPKAIPYFVTIHDILMQLYALTLEKRRGGGGYSYDHCPRIPTNPGRSTPSVRRTRGVVNTLVRTNETRKPQQWICGDRGYIYWSEDTCMHLVRSQQQWSQNHFDFVYGRGLGSFHRWKRKFWEISITDGVQYIQHTHSRYIRRSSVARHDVTMGRHK